MHRTSNPSSTEAGTNQEAERTGSSSTTNTMTSTSITTTSNIPDKASGSRGPISADAMDQPELVDTPRRLLANSEEHRNFIIPVKPRSSRGPVGAEVIPPPEPTDNPRHSMAAGRGTEKGVHSYPPVDNEGSKPTTMNQDDEEFKKDKPYKDDKECGNNGSSDDITFPQRSRNEYLNENDKEEERVGGSRDNFTLPHAEAVKPRFVRSSDNVTSRTPQTPLRKLCDRRAVPVHALSNAREYDRWQAKIGGVPNPFVGSSSSPAFGSVAQTTLPVAGPVLTPSAGGALLGSTPFCSSLTNTKTPGLKRCHIKSVTGQSSRDITGEYLSPTIGLSPRPASASVAHTTLQAVGSILTPSAGGALLGSTPSSPTSTCSNSTTRYTQMPSPTKSPSVPGRPRSTTLAIQWNMNGFFNNLGDLEILVQNNSPMFLALQETHRANIGQMNRTLASKFHWINNCSQSNIYHSVAVGIADGIPFTPINLNTDLPIVGAKVESPFPLSVINIYLPHGKIPDLLNKLQRALALIDGPLLLLGDVNGHHPSWGSPKANPRGSTIAELIESLDLVTLNDGSSTFVRGQYETTIDISAASPAITGRLLWKTLEDPAGSDHYPIIISLGDDPPETSRRPRWLYDQADWKLFNDNVTQAYIDHPATSMEEFMGIITEAANIAIPKTSPNPGRKPLHWWCPEAKSAIKARRKALRAAKRLPKDHPDKERATELYRSKRNECRQIIRDAKKSSWEEFLEGINSNQTASELWSRVNALNGKRKARGMALRLQSGLTRDPLTIANELADYFASLSAIDRYDRKFIQKNHASTQSLGNIVIPEDSVPTPINAPFRFDELTLALSRSKGKSAGPDDIGYPMLQHLPSSTKVELLDLINKIWIENTLPNEWSHSLVVPIPKQGQVASTPENFRPISLTCCISKVMERMVNRRLIRFLEDNDHLDHRQHAFRSGHGTGTYFTGLGDVLQEAMDEELHVDIAALDLAKAYNRAWTPQVIKQLADWGLGGHILHFLKNFLCGRSFQVMIGNHRSSTRAEETGVPQGSVLAVTIFLVAMNGVFGILPKGIYIFVYADDIVLLALGRTLKALRRKLQAAVSATTRWASRVGFELSAEKSVVSHLCHFRHRPLPTAIVANNIPIPNKKTIQVLGVRLDRELRFDAHFNEIKANCRTRLNLLRTLSKPHRSSNREILLKVAKATVNSRLFYGIELFCLSNDSLTTRLAPTYNQAIRIVAGLLPSTPAESACVELGVLPFQYQVAETLSCRTTSYLEKTTGNHEVFLLREGNRVLGNLVHQELPPVSRVHWNGARGWTEPTIRVDLSIAKRFKAGNNSRAMQAHVAELLRTKYPNFQHRYTDGSKAVGKVGFGVADVSNSYFFRLPDQCSVFSAEAAAIHFATTTPANKPICVLTDSASVLYALNSATSRHPWIQGIQKAAPPNTSFVWVPGHCGIRGNCEADHLAATGRSGRMATTVVPSQDVKKWVKASLRDAWAREWFAKRGPFLRKIKDDTSKWNDITSRWEQQVLSRLRSGHTRVTHNMGSAASFRKFCDSCNTIMTVEHLIVNCPCFHNIRLLYGIPNSIRNALSNDPSTEAALIVFLKDAGLFDKI
ncbi:uncharacterized protein LOC135712853 [Ochlerotatus camptorhynchus]|uniref:uncharacterized protein LOC135712853 n=1 Tax=Ochlerotatus camptorhynchus TaxID=644619 RepID=UPI0031E2A612